MDNYHIPRLSVIFVTPDRYQVIQRTVRSLQSQTIKDQLEVIIVAPSAANLDLDASDLQGFYRFKVVETGVNQSAGDTRVAGMRQASAPIVAYLEDHAFPVNSTWAESLLKTHEEPWAAVAPTLENGNPESLISWASYLLCFGMWANPQSLGCTQSLPWRNVSYKRSVLMKYGDELANLFVAEYALHQDLVSKGYQLYLDPSTKLYHLNFTHLIPMLQEQFFVGRVFGAGRAQSWSLLRRLLYIIGGPLIPCVRVWRLSQGWQGILRQHQLMPHIISPLIAGLLTGCFGEWIGYLSGFGSSLEEELTKIEVSPDRQLLSP